MKNLSYLFLICLLCFSCGKDDETDPQTDNGSITVIKAGVSFETDVTNNTLVFETSTDGNNVEGRRLDVRCNVDGGTFILTVSNVDFQNPPDDGILTKVYGTNDDFQNSDCMDFTNATYCDGALITYLTATSEIFSSEGFELEEKGSITITANDPTKKTVSGTFDATLIKNTIDGNEKVVFSGSFTDLIYRVQ